MNALAVRPPAAAMDAAIANVEAEHQLLGTILMNNRAFGMVAGFLKGEHFSVDWHGKVYEACRALIDRGEQATPVTLKTYFANDRAEDLDGGKQLWRLAKAAVTMINTGDHGRIILDAYQRRQALAIIEEARERLLEPTLDVDATQVLLDTAAQAEALTAQGATRALTTRQIRERLVERMSNPPPYHSTGFHLVDKAMGGGLFEGKVYGFMARKKQGKTIWAGSFSRNLNLAGVPHLCLWGEMGGEEIEHRNLANELGVNSLAFLDNRGRENLIRLVANAAIDTPEHGLYVDVPGLTFDEMKRHVLHAILTKRVKVIILDYLQLVRGKKRDQTRAELYEDVAQWLADTARRRRVAFVVFGQMNQEGNVRHGEGILLACDQCFEIKRDQGGKGTGVWLEMMDTRYTRWQDVGTEDRPAFFIDEAIGPRILESNV